MPRTPSARPPQPRLHKPSGLSYIRLAGQFIYLGKDGSPEAAAEYDRIIAEWLSSGRSLAVVSSRTSGKPARPAGGRGPGIAPGDITINEVAAAWLEWAEGYYRRDGEPTAEVEALTLAVRPLVRLYGSTPARAFSPLKLKAVRDVWVDEGISRKEINRRVQRIRRLFGWGVEQELIPVETWQALKAVKGLKAGRCAAPDHPPVRPVDLGVVEAMVPFLPPMLAAMVRLQALTGMRSGELVRLRAGDIDRSGPVWVYTPARHKTDYRGRDRAVYLGPRAQEILSAWLKPDSPMACLFSPRERMQAHWEDQRSARQTKVQPSQESRRKAAPKRRAGERYSSRSYNRALLKGWGKANEARAAGGQSPLPRWSPHQLRHALATRLRAEYGVDMAKVMLGHASLDATAIYAEKDDAKARRVAEELG